MSQRGTQRQTRQPTRGAQGRAPARQPAGDMTWPRGAGAYPADLVPVALAGDYVELRPAGEVRQVEVVVAVPTLLAFDSGKSNGVTANSNDTTADQEATELEQRTDWLAQYRFLFPDADIPQGISTVTLDLGGNQAPLYTSKNQRGFIEQDTSALGGYSAATELYIFENEPPKFSFTNTTGSNITVNDLRFGGFQYQLSPATELPAGVQPVVLPTEAIGSISG